MVVGEGRACFVWVDHGFGEPNEKYVEFTIADVCVVYVCGLMCFWVGCFDRSQLAEQTHKHVHRTTAPTAQQEQVAGIITNMQVNSPGFYQIKSPADPNLIMQPLNEVANKNTFKKVRGGCWG